MRNTLLVMWREYFTQIRTRSFILTTLFAPILIVLVTLVVIYMMRINETHSTIAVIDGTQQLYTEFKTDKKQTFVFYTENELKSLQDTLAESKTIDAILYIPSSKDSLFLDIENKIQLYSNKSLNKNLLHTIDAKITAKFEEIRLDRIGIKKSDLDKLKSNINIKITNVKDGQLDSTSSLKDILSLSLMYVVMMFIIIYGTRVMRSVMEEKNNRVVEIIISSVKPFDLMMGKILGTTLVALTQFVIWISGTMILLFIGQFFIGQELSVYAQNTTTEIIPDTDILFKIKDTIDALLSLNYWLIIFIFLFFFFSGYLFYSSFFAAIGAAVDNDTETQQFMPIVVAPLMLGAYGSITIINNPEGPIAFWLSVFPFTSPLVMVTRSFYGVPIWELVLSIVLMLISVIGMVYIAGKIYRVGILMYGKKVNFKELFKWIKQS